MLTIINVKTGEVKQEDLKNVAEGQVLIKNCSEALIEQLVNVITGVANNPPTSTHTTGNQASQATYRPIIPPPPPTPQEIKQAKQRIAQAKECGGNCCKVNRPTEDQVTAALNKAQKGQTCKDVESAKDVTSKGDLLTEKKDLVIDLVETLTLNDEFISALLKAVNNSTETNPDQGKITATNLLVVLILYAHFNTDIPFTAGEGRAAYDAEITAGRDMIRSIAQRTRLIDTDYSTPAKYNVTRKFEIIFDKVLLRDNFADLYHVICTIENQIDEINRTLLLLEDKET